MTPGFLQDFINSFTRKQEFQEWESTVKNLTDNAMTTCEMEM